MIKTTIRNISNEVKKKFIKCVVWDLDNTIWDGVLLEDDNISLRENVIKIIKSLDHRGILQSIASKNNYNQAMTKLNEFGLGVYFLYPQITWKSKASSIETISNLIDIGLDTMAFVDDEPFEREEVNFSFPEVLCVDAARLDRLLEMPEINPGFITEDSVNRRLKYLNNIERTIAEEEFVGTKEEFLATLDIVLTISIAKEEHLKRAEELTVRTNQLNTTGRAYSHDELNYYRQSENHKLFIASLEDKFGSYGKIGLSLIECSKDLWTIKLLLISCRVISHGIGTIMINYIMNLASSAKVCLRAEFVPNSGNRMMYITYKFAGFKEIKKIGDLLILETNLKRIQRIPEFMKVEFID